MSNLERRQLLQAGFALSVPFAGTFLHNEIQESTTGKAKEDDEKKGFQIQYLEIVTPKVDELCKQYSAMHGIEFSEPVASFGNARIADLKGGGQIGIRGPMRANETPVIRPYMLVKDIKKAVEAAEKAGAEIAIREMTLPGHGTIAIVIQGGIECGLWQL